MPLPFIRHKRRRILNVGSAAAPYTNTSSISFDGFDDYISISDSNDLSFGDGSSDSPFSISAWVKFGTLQNSRIFSKRAGGTTGREYQLSYNANKIQFTLYDQSESWAYIYAENTANSLFAGQWYHVVATYDGSGSENGLTLYVNNVDVTTTRASSGAYTAMENGTSDVYIGSNGYDATYCVDGLIDEVAIIGSELSAAQVSTIYGSEAPTSLSAYSPVGWWRMGDNDGATGTTITDQGSGANNGTLTNGPTFSTDIPVYTFNRYSVDFDGVDDYLAVADAAELSFGDASTDSPFSISAWVKSDNWNKFRIATKGNSSSDAEFIFGGDGASKLALYLFDAAHSVNIGRSYNTILNTGQWYHVGVTYDGSGVNTGIELYVDGVKLTSVTNQGSGSYTAMHNTTGELSIGRSYIPDYGSGLIDEVAIFSSELSEADMTAIYNDGEPSDISSYSPVGWWRMGDNDGAIGTTITDQGSGGNNGTLTNGPTFLTDIPS